MTDHIPVPVVEDKPYHFQTGDRIIYDTRTGTLYLYTVDGSPALFRREGKVEERCFVGRAWSRDHTREFAELVIRMAGCQGEVQEVEGSFPSLWSFAVQPHA